MADPEEFEALVCPLYGEFFKIALHMTGNQHDATDLVQATFEKALRSFHGFQLGTNIGAWMQRIIESTCSDMYKQRSKGGFVTDEIDEFDFGDAGQGESDLIEDLGHEEALSGLSELDRTVASLKADGLQYAEIEERLGFSEREIRESLDRTRFAVGRLRLRGAAAVGAGSRRRPP